MIGADKLAKEPKNEPYIQWPETVADKKTAIANLNDYNRFYMNSRQQGKPFNQEVIKQLSEEFKKRGHEIPEPPEDILCPVSQIEFNVPVKVITIIPKPNGEPERHEHFFDYSTLMQFYKANEAAFKSQKIFCTHPLNRLPIKAYDLLPAPEIQEKIDAYIEVVKEQLEKISMPAESSRSRNKIT